MVRTKVPPSLIYTALAVGGFVLVIAGLAFVSTPVALIVAGLGVLIYGALGIGMLRERP